MTVYRFLRAVIPSPIRRSLNRALGYGIQYRGPYPSWDAASEVCRGYSDAAILARVRDATTQVLQGKAEYEQDGVACHGTPPISTALTALLLANGLDGKLSVLDFGGGLGSHYVRWKSWLAELPNVTWCVLEQPEFVAAGRALFCWNQSISFVESIDEARGHPPNAILASSVLQYLQNPLHVLQELIGLGAKVIVIDRTPIARNSRTRLLTQHVPRSIGLASYPLHTFARAELTDLMESRYKMLVEFPTADAAITVAGAEADFLGSVWLRKD